jgi:hypothetical protein
MRPASRIVTSLPGTIQPSTALPDALNAWSTSRADCAKWMVAPTPRARAAAATRSLTAAAVGFLVDRTPIDLGQGKQQVHLLLGDVQGHAGKAGDIASRMRHRLHEALAHGVGYREHDNRDARCGVARRFSCERGQGKDDVRASLRDPLGGLLEAQRIVLAKSRDEGQVPTFHVAALRKLPLEAGDGFLVVGRTASRRQVRNFEDAWRL